MDGRLAHPRLRVRPVRGALACLLAALAALLVAAPARAAGPPANSSAPVIGPASGTRLDGQLLTTSNGVWTNTPTAYSYQWRKCDSAGANCADIAGATNNAYRLTSAEIGATIRAVVTASNASGAGTGTSAQTTVVMPAPPSNTSLPFISAALMRDGQVLTGNIGAWSGTVPINYAYQWKRCNTTGASCVNIPGAGTTSYTLTSTDVGQTIRFQVTASNQASGSVIATSAQTGVVGADPPSNTGLPVVTGFTQDGQTLSASQGSWDGTAPLSLSYQWQRCDPLGTCTDIMGATSQSYRLVSADVGATVRVTVTASNGAGSISAASDPTNSIVAAGPLSTAAPAVSGTAKDGQTLTSSTGAWSGTTPQTYTYEWLRCDAAGASCAVIPGATGNTYTAVSDDVGSTLKSRVTATNGAGTATATSARTVVVVASPPANSALPAITGDLTDGSDLTVQPGDWTGTTPMDYSYQWYRCSPAGTCLKITGAVDTTYTLAPADVGNTLKVAETVRNTADTLTATSPKTGTIQGSPPVGDTPPSITGGNHEGDTVTASNGTWSGVVPMTFTYQWWRCDVNGEFCSPITGATSVNYTLQPTDVGLTLRVDVLATNPDGATTASSGVTAVGTGRPPVSLRVPVISGPPVAGQTMTASTGSWSGTPPMNYTYQWETCDGTGNNCSDIPAATNPTFVPSTTDVGARLRVRVRAQNAVDNAVAESDPSPAILVSPPQNTDPPTIIASSVPADTRVLVADPGLWDGAVPDNPSFKWRRCDAVGSSCQDINGAISSAYLLTPADVGHTVRVTVTVSNAVGPSSISSDATDLVLPAPPTSVGAPAITVAGGSVREGATLTSSNGSWTGGQPFTYGFQWLRCDDAGDNCQPILDAGSASYVLTADDLGHRIKVTVSVTNPTDTVSRTSDPTVPVAGAPPVNKTAPALSAADGKFRDGSTITATTGSWTGTLPLSYSYQWKRCSGTGSNCADVPGATSSTYHATGDDVGSRLVVAVTAANIAGSATSSSPPSAAVAALPPTGVGAPTISVADGGTLSEGTTLKADAGNWAGSPPMTFTYQWQRCPASTDTCSPISGATKDTYKIQGSDVRQRVKVVVTAKNAAGSLGAPSNPTDVIAAVAPASAQPPAIVVGALGFVPSSLLTAKPGVWTGTMPISYAYKWQSCDASGNQCQDLPNATQTSYGLAAGDVDAGKKLARPLRVVVTATNSAGSATAASVALGASAKADTGNSPGGSDGTGSGIGTGAGTGSAKLHRRLTSRMVMSSKTHLMLVLGCPRRMHRACNGRIVLRAKGFHRAGNFKLRAGKAHKFRFTLRPAELAKLGKVRKLRATLDVTLGRARELRTLAVRLPGK